MRAARARPGEPQHAFLQLICVCALQMRPCSLARRMVCSENALGALEFNQNVPAVLQPDSDLCTASVASWPGSKFSASHSAKTPAMTPCLALRKAI